MLITFDYNPDLGVNFTMKNTALSISSLLERKDIVLEAFEKEKFTDEFLDSLSKKELNQLETILNTIVTYRKKHKDLNPFQLTLEAFLRPKPSVKDRKQLIKDLIQSLETPKDTPQSLVFDDLLQKQISSYMKKKEADAVNLEKIKAKQGVKPKE